MEVVSLADQSQNPAPLVMLVLSLLTKFVLQLSAMSILGRKNKIIDTIIF